MTKEIQVLEAKVVPLVSQANNLAIATQEDMVKATAVLSNLGRYYDSVVAKREEITKPANATLHAARAMFDPIEKPAKAAIEALRTRIGAWQTAETKRANEEKNKIAERIAPGKGNLSIETAVKKLDAIATPEAAIATNEGSLKFRVHQVLTITNESLIPREYLIVDEVKLKAALKGGVKVPGAELVETQIPINSR